MWCPHTSYSPSVNSVRLVLNCDKAINSLVSFLVFGKLAKDKKILLSFGLESSKFALGLFRLKAWKCWHPYYCCTVSSSKHVNALKLAFSEQSYLVDPASSHMLV